MRLEDYFFNYEIEQDNIKLYKGYAYKGKKTKIFVMNVIIENAKEKGYNFLEYRTIKNYVAEWYFHNFLFRLHLFRKHTKDIDFQRQFKHTFRDTVEKIIYKIIEIFI